jgi:hypothetical protein
MSRKFVAVSDRRLLRLVALSSHLSPYTFACEESARIEREFSCYGRRGLYKQPMRGVARSGSESEGAVAEATLPGVFEGLPLGSRGLGAQEAGAIGGPGR